MIESFGKKSPTNDDDFLTDEGFLFRSLFDLIKLYLTRVKKIDFTFHAQFIDQSEPIKSATEPPTEPETAKKSPF